MFAARKALVAYGRFSEALYARAGPLPFVWYCGLPACFAQSEHAKPYLR